MFGVETSRLGCLIDSTGPQQLLGALSSSCVSKTGSVPKSPIVNDARPHPRLSVDTAGLKLQIISMLCRPARADPLESQFKILTIPRANRPEALSLRLAPAPSLDDESLGLMSRRIDGRSVLPTLPLPGLLWYQDATLPRVHSLEILGCRRGN